MDKIPDLLLFIVTLDSIYLVSKISILIIAYFLLSDLVDSDLNF